MIREEEIFQRAKEVGEFIANTSPSTYNAALRGFCRGAEFADKTMLDRACEWLKENIDLYSDTAFSIKSGYTEITLTDEFETAFRQAMEGGAE